MKGGHGILYRDHSMAPATVLFGDPCLFPRFSSFVLGQKGPVGCLGRSLSF